MRMTELDRLAEFVGRHSRLFVLTGAGCSTGSGIPDYRDEEGRWKRPQPMTLQVFLAEAGKRGKTPGGGAVKKFDQVGGGGFPRTRIPDSFSECRTRLILIRYLTMSSELL